MDGKEQADDKIGVCGAGVMGRQGWDVWGWGKWHGSGMWGGVAGTGGGGIAGLGRVGLGLGWAGSVQGRLGVHGAGRVGALASQVKGTTSMWPQVGDERQRCAGSAWL